MNVLIVAMKYLPESGGSARYADNLARGLASRGHHVILLAPAYSRDSDDQNLPFRVYRYRWANPRYGQWRLLLTAMKVKQLIRTLRPDVVWATSYAGARALGLLRPYVSMTATLHGGGIQRAFRSLNPLKLMTDLAGLKFLKSAKLLVTISEHAKCLILSFLKESSYAEKFHVIYNGIEYDESAFYDKKQAIEKLRQYQGKRIILTLARLVKAKGQDLVIKAMPLILKEIPNAAYVIVGEGVEEQALKALVKEKHLEASVFFTGYITDVEREWYYGIADVVVLAGRWTSTFVEGFGLVFLEANIRGKAVVGTRVGGIPEAIDNYKTGIIVEPDHPEQIASTIIALLKDDDMRAEMGAAGRRWVQSRFSLGTMASQSDAFLARLVRRAI